MICKGIWKWLVVIVVFCLNAKIVNGQTAVGIRGGYGNYGVSFEPPSIEMYQKNLGGYNAGLVFSFCPQKEGAFVIGGLRAEVNYAQKGWREVYNNSQDTFFIRHLNYLELPLLSQGEIFEKNFRLILGAGPVLSYKIDDRIEISNFDTAGAKYGHYDKTVKNYHLGIRVFGGVKYTIAKKVMLFAEVRYNVDMAGASEIFIDRPNYIQASRIKELSYGFGVMYILKWNVIAKKKNVYIPKEGLIYNFGDE